MGKENSPKNANEIAKSLIDHLANDPELKARLKANAKGRYTSIQQMPKSLRDLVLR